VEQKAAAYFRYYQCGFMGSSSGAALANQICISIIQRSQSKILRIMMNAPWYVNNQTLHTDLNIPSINDVIKEKSIIHHNKLASHPNDILQPLVEPQQNRRLGRNWPADLKEN
jgi:hypothetical protein